MASKSAQQEPERAEVVEELLDALDTTLDRVKVLYEQYFLGIQKQPPTYLHTDIERKLRDLTQMQIRNTAMRYRFVTLQQKFGSYNSYWRRTLRQIESGTYTRNLSKIGRQVARTGAAVPEEILAAMPKRMREQVKRDREAALVLARLRDQLPAEPELLTLADEDVDVDLDDLEPAAFISESTDLRRNALTASRVHELDESDADFDLDAFFKAVTTEDEPPSLESLRQSTGPAPAGASSAPSSTGVSWQTSSPSPRASPSPSPRIEPPRVEPPAVRSPPTLAPSQATRSIPVMPGASASRTPTSVESLSGPFPRIPSIPGLPRELRATTGAVPAADRPVAPREPTAPGPLPVAPRTAALPPERPSVTMRGPTAPRAAMPEPAPVERAPTPRPPPAHVPPIERRPPEPRQGPPPGMTEADVNALYATYVKAKQILGEEADPGAYGKLLKTINAQAPKIMEQYKAKGVDFSVVVKDNQVIIRAKPKP